MAINPCHDRELQMGKTLDSISPTSRHSRVKSASTTYQDATNDSNATFITPHESSNAIPSAIILLPPIIGITTSYVPISTVGLANELVVDRTSTSYSSFIPLRESLWGSLRKYMATTYLSWNVAAGLPKPVPKQPGYHLPVDAGRPPIPRRL